MTVARLLGQTCATVKHFGFKYTTDAIIDKRQDSCAQPLQPAQTPFPPFLPPSSPLPRRRRQAAVGLSSKNPTHCWTSGSEVKQSMTEQPTTDCVRSPPTDNWRRMPRPTGVTAARRNASLRAAYLGSHQAMPPIWAVFFLPYAAYLGSLFPPPCCLSGQSPDHAASLGSLPPQTCRLSGQCFFLHQMHNSGTKRKENFRRFLIIKSSWIPGRLTIT